jgi:ribonuclease HII
MITVGIDEVGRGCWAGPVVAAAVILDESIPGVMDSKLLTRSKRESIELAIQERAVAIGLGWVHAADVDRLGLTEAVRTAMAAALEAIRVPYDRVIIDGNLNYLQNYQDTEAMIRADSLVPAVSAASIIAKVARDRYMTAAARRYPGYGFERHVGYGTAMHLANLQQYGVCDLHRRSFKPVKALLASKPEPL